MRKADPMLANLWRSRIQRQKTSGQSIAAFCFQEGVSVAAFYSWRRKLAQTPSREPSPSKRRSAKAEFLPVHIRQEPPTPHVVEVELPNHIILRLAANAPPKLARRLLRDAAELGLTQEAKERRRP
jgi:hypothetical protein